MRKLFVLALLVFTMNAGAQEVTRKGNLFVAEKKATTKSVENPADKTSYKYQDVDGKTYDLYVSKNGKAYIIRTSKKGNKYRKYLPEVSKELELESIKKDVSCNFSEVRINYSIK